MMPKLKLYILLNRTICVIYKSYYRIEYNGKKTILTPLVSDLSRTAGIKPQLFHLLARLEVWQEKSPEKL